MKTRRSIALLLAIVMCISFLPTGVVYAEEAPAELEFVLGLSAFNKANMIEGANYTSEPVLRPTHKLLYFKPMMHWDYEVPAEYAANGEAFKAMDLTKTDKWAFDSFVQTKGSPTLYDGMFHLEFKYANHSHATEPAVVALKLKPETTGTYILQVNGANTATNACPAVYFFKNGEEGVVNNSPATYPTNSKLGYFNAPVDGGAYTTIGNVNIDDANAEYIVAFHLDAESAQMNTNVAGDVQNLQLSGIKLVPTEADELAGIELTSDKTTLFVGGSKANLAVAANYTVSGKVEADIEDVEFSVSPADIVEVAEDGTVTALAKGTATITAAFAGEETSVDVVVAEADSNQHDLSYVIGLDAFNKANMIEDAAYGSTPTLRPTLKLLYYRPAMHWDFEVPAEYAANGEAFKAMDLTKTDPWAYEAHFTAVSNPVLYDGNLTYEYNAKTYAGADTGFIAFRLKVDAAGEYDLMVNSAKRNDAPAPAVYFFKAGIDGVTTSDEQTYPASAKVGYYNASTASGSTKVATVGVAEAGEYILAFVADAKSLSLSPTYVDRNSCYVQTFQIADIALKKAVVEEEEEDELSAIELSANKTALEVGDSATLETKATWTVSGEKAVDAADVEFAVAPAGVVSVAADGKVTALAAGEATITATYEGKTDTVTITVTDPNAGGEPSTPPAAEQREHEYLISQAGLNTDKMQTLADYSGKPVIRQANKAIYFFDMLHWDYIVPAEYSNTDPQAEFPAMNLDATDKWAFAGKTVSLGNPLLEQKRLAMQFTTETYTQVNSNMIALELYVEAPGDYELFGKSTATNIGAVPMVYFFPKSAEGVTLGTASTYPENSALTYFNMATSSDYTKIGKVTVPAAGSYYVVFQADKNSLSYNSTTSAQSNKNYQWFDIAALKLSVAAKDELSSIALAADKTTLEVGDSATLETKATWTVSGEKAVDAEDVEFAVAPAGVVEVSDAGVVTALTAGTATITATYEGKTASVDFTVAADTLSAIELTSDKTTLFLGGNKAALAVSATYTVSGEKALDLADVEFSVSPEGVVEIAADGKVSAVAEGTATIKAAYEGKEASLEVSVVAPGEIRTHEFVFSQAGFNTDKMIKGANHGTTPVLREANSCIYFPAMLDWTYEVPAEYSSDGAAFMALDITEEDGDAKLTDKWAFVDKKQTLGGWLVEPKRFAMQFTPAHYGTAESNFIVVKIYVDAPGEYDLFGKTTGNSAGAVPAVYFFANGTAGVTNNAPATYPAASKLGYFNMSTAKEYVKLGSVSVAEPGEYIVSFAVDGTSLAKNPTTLNQSGTAYQWFELTALKLEKAAVDTFTGISAAADKTTLLVDGTASISLKELWSVTGEKDLAAGDVDFTVEPAGVVEVSADGKVTAVANGTATVTATLKADNTKTAAVEFTVEEDVFESVAVKTDVEKIFIDGEAQLIITETWSVTGNRTADLADYDIVTDPADVIEISADGKITALAEEATRITVTNKEDSTKTAYVDFEVSPPLTAQTKEYVIGLSAFNKSKMMGTTDSSLFINGPYLRSNAGNVLYFKSAMSWKYSVPANFYAEGNPAESFKTMDLAKTAPWELVDYKLAVGQGILYDNQFALEFDPVNYTSAAPSYAAFRLNIEAPGEYILQVKGDANTDAPVPAVYFYKDGTEGVTNTAVATYPAASKLGYFEFKAAGAKYKTVAIVNVEEAGDYIISFVADKTSKEMNSATAASGAKQVQNFRLQGVKIIPSSEDRATDEIIVTAKNQAVMVSRTMQIDLARVYAISGAIPVTDYSAYEFKSADEEIITVDENGVVTGVAASENPVKIRVSLKEDPDVKAEIAFMVIPLSEQETYEYKFQSSAFNYEQMKGVTGINATTTDDLYYRDLVAELGFAPSPAAAMFMNEKLADPALKIPVNYYGDGTPTEEFYVMDTTDEDGDPKGTDPWKYVGGRAIDNANTTVFQLRGDTADDGFHPYYDRDQYTDTKDTQFSAFSLTVPQKGEYMLTIQAKPHGAAPCPAVYFFKDEAGAYADASFIETEEKLGYLMANDVKKKDYQYIATINVPEAGNYVVAFVMDATTKGLSQNVNGYHGVGGSQYISLMGVKLVPLYEDKCTGISIEADTDLMYMNETLQMRLNEVWEIVGEKEIFDLSTVVFTSSDEEIATVDENGVVTGVNKGEVTITATKKNTYPEVKASFKITVYDPNEPILGVRHDYVTGTIAMKDQTTYNPHNNRLDTSGNLRDLTYVDEYKEIDPTVSSQWAFANRGGLTWSCLQKLYMSLATAPSAYANNPYFAVKIRVPIRGEYYFNGNVSPMNYGSEADVHILPAADIATVNVSYATTDNFVGTIDGTGADSQRLGLVNIPNPGDYYVIFKLHSDNPALDGEGRNFFALKGFTLAAPAGPYTKVGMYINGVDAEGIDVPYNTLRDFTFKVCDAAGVEQENVDYATEVTVNSLEITKGKGTLADLIEENGKYLLQSYSESGEVVITANVTYKGVTVETPVTFYIADIAKNGRTIYTDEMIANARENIAKYDWAKSARDSVIKQADKFVALGAEYIWNMIPGNGLPRAYNVALEISHPVRDPFEFYCRYCNTDLLSAGYGNYPWVVNTFTDPWKIKCPECSRQFPTNDFGKFYELGRTQMNGGLFDRDTALENHRKMLIEKGLLSDEAIAMTSPGSEYTETWYKYYGYGVKGGYLYNDLYPEVGNPNSGVKFATEAGIQNGSATAYKTIVPETVERWGVDDGHGYVTGRVYTNGVKEFHTYAAYFAHFGIWQFSGTAITASALDYLGKAYMYTGDEKYGRLGAIILDRVADVYPDMSIKYWSSAYGRRYPNSTGGSPAGKDLGRIWGCFTAEIYADSYDVFYPMLEDPEVIKFLSNKASYYGMENDKSTALRIRKNIEDGICREIFNACKTSQIMGNFGLHHAAIIKAAVALDDREDTAAMIDWLYAASTTDSHSYNTGGDVNRKLLETVYRDGMVNESPYYNQMATSDLIESAIVLQRYVENGGDLDCDALLEHPKYLKAITSFIPLVRLHRGVVTHADTDNALNFPKYPSVSMLISAINVLKENDDPDIREEMVKMAQQLWLYEGENLKDQHYDIWTKDPETIYEEVENIIKTYGEYDWDKSSIMTGYGIGILRGGALYDTVGITGVRDTTRDVVLNFSGHNLHNHHDMLDMQISAYGLPFTFDFGYAEFMVTGDPHSNQLTSATIGHNTVVVDEQNSVGSQVDSGGNRGAGVPQKPLHFDAKDTKVKVIDAETPTAYPQTDDYRRTLVMVDYDDEISYTVDFFRVNGGKDHLYTFQPAADTRPEHSDNLTFVKQVDEPLDTWRDDHKNYYPFSSYAGPSVQFGEDPGGYGNLKYPHGYTWMYDVERADNPGTGEFWLDYAIEDFRGRSRNPILDVRLRLTMLNDFNVDEVSLTSMKPQRIKTNQKIDHFEKILVRRKGADLDSLFTAVYEPYKAGERYVSNIEQVEIARTGGATERKDDVAKAVKVTIGDNRIDYVVYATNRDVIYTITDGDYSFEFAGFVGVWTVDAEGTSTYSYLHDGSTLGEGERKIENHEPAVTGKIVDFQREFSLDNWIDIEFDNDMSEEAIADLADRMIVPERFADGTSAYLIEGITKTGDNTARINLNSTSTVDSYIDIENPDKGYVYVLEGGEDFEIPMSYEDAGNPTFDEVGSQAVSVGSLLTVKVSADPVTDDLTVTYRERTLPRGAGFDAETATLTWKPTATQLGKHLVAIDAVDSLGRVSTVYFEVQVFGSTTGGGGGGGGGAPSKPEEPSEPDEPSDPTDPTEPDEPTEIPEESKKFVDLGNHTWAEDAINELAADGIIKGTSETTFAPAANITRADYAILLVRAFDLESDNDENFADVDASDYFAKELAVARNTGLVGGIGDNKYAPRDTISRQDMMVIIYRAFDKLGYELKKVDGVDAETFADFDDVADYARDAVRALVESGLVNGKSGLIAGSDKTTRAEVAVLLKRMLDYIA